MKKFVSVAVLTAMIASMGVGAMADVSFGSGGSTDVAWPSNFAFGDRLIVESSNDSVTEYGEGQKISLKPGDVIYMPLTHTTTVEEEAPEVETPEVETPEETPEVETPETETPDAETPETEGEGSEEAQPVMVAEIAPQAEVTAPYSGKVDKDWKIKFTAGKFVDDAIFYTATAKDTNLQQGALYIKVEMDEELDSVDTETITYGIYISENGTKNKTERVNVKADFANVYGGDVDFDYPNHVIEPSVWEVKDEKSGKASFDFQGEAYFDVNMYDGEKVLLNLSREYDRALAIANEDAQLEFFNFRGEHDEFIRRGTLSLPGDEDAYVYEIVDGDLYEVDFKYNDDEETLEITTDTLGHYVVSDMELVAAEKPNSGSSNNNNSNSGSSADKNNPSTGASDFVGSAAAMAVVSVAAAGALALKRKK